MLIFSGKDGWRMFQGKYSRYNKPWAVFYGCTRATAQMFQKVVLKFDLHNDKAKEKAMKVVSSLSARTSKNSMPPLSITSRKLSPGDLNDCSDGECKFLNPKRNEAFSGENLQRNEAFSGENLQKKNTVTGGAEIFYQDYSEPISHPPINN